MINKLGRAYNSLDGLIMKGVNKGAHAWNWTTGKTRSDLANKFIFASNVTFITGTFFIHPALTFVSFPTGAHFSYKIHKEYLEMDEEEQEATYEGLKNPYVEEMKWFFKLIGPVCIFAGGAIPTMKFSSSSKVDDDRINMGFGLIGASYGLAGSSLYIIRADYLPPRKNCLSRGMDKLKDLARNYQRQPGLTT